MRTIWMLVVLAACDSGAPSCKDAVAKDIGHGAVVRDEIVKVCEDKKWSGNVRGCLARATSKAKADECLDPVIDDVFAARNAKAAKAAIERIELMQKEFDEMTNQVAAVTEVMDATSDEARAAAQAKLHAVELRRADVEAKIAALRAAATRSERANGVHISPECLDNPLAKGCP